MQEHVGGGGSVAVAVTNRRRARVGGISVALSAEQGPSSEVGDDHRWDAL